MSRNMDSHFGNAPMKNIRRSSFKMPCTLSTSFNTGEIIPIYTNEVLPGDTAKIKTSMLIRMATPIAPVMDNAWVDLYYFFVPRRLVWEHWSEFMGENTTDAWTQETEYQIPQLTTPDGGWNKGTLGEKLYGIQGRTGSVDACYARAYTLIFNEWFRNENITEPAEITFGDSTTAGSNGNDYVVDMQKGGQLAKAVKYADYFTRALPEPQKGPDVYLPLGTTAPVRGNIPISGNEKPLGFIGEKDAEGYYRSYVIGNEANGTTLLSRYYATNPAIGENITDGGRHGGLLGLHTSETLSGIQGSSRELYADLTSASAATINQLRQAFAVQRMYEIDARGGTRYTEILRAHFGVTSPDSRQQRPEYLGGRRVPINISQVIQNSETSTTPQGTTSAYSLTIDSKDDFTWSSTEHGIIMGLAVIRTEHTYQQGIERKFSRKNRTDFYWPALSNIGEQGIYNKEIYATGTSTDEEIFGYQEAWAEYRYMNNRVTGELNSDYSQSLDLWTYADDYSSTPTLSDEWIRETTTNVERTLAITTQDQWIANFYFDQTWVRPMPIYSIPQLSSWN